MQRKLGMEQWHQEARAGKKSPAACAELYGPQPWPERSTDAAGLEKDALGTLRTD